MAKADVSGNLLLGLNILLAIYFGYRAIQAWSRPVVELADLAMAVGMAYLAAPMGWPMLPWWSTAGAFAAAAGYLVTRAAWPRGTSTPAPCCSLWHGGGLAAMAFMAGPKTTQTATVGLLGAGLFAFLATWLLARSVQPAADWAGADWAGADWAGADWEEARAGSGAAGFLSTRQRHLPPTLAQAALSASMAAGLWLMSSPH